MCARSGRSSDVQSQVLLQGKRVLVGPALCANVGVPGVLAVMAVMTKMLVTVGARRRTIGIPGGGPCRCGLDGNALPVMPVLLSSKVLHPMRG